MSEALLAVARLGVEIATAPGWVPLLQDVSLRVSAGETLGIVGPSGAGKTTLAHAFLRVLPGLGRFTPDTEIRWRGEVLTRAAAEHWRGLRGRGIAIVPQEPLLALTPARRIGALLAEAVVAHGLADARGAAERVERALADVGIDDPAEAMQRFPHQFSGGQRQRLLIAAALVLDPSMIIADEPTTALDPTLQAQVLDLLEAHRARSGCALVLVSHDLDVIGERCQRVVVMDAGRVVEDAPATTLLRAPSSAAAHRLVAARRQRAAVAEATEPRDAADLLVATDLAVQYRERRWLRARGTTIAAVSGVSLRVARGESLGIVGESGCGKTSVARALLRLGPLQAGRVTFDGVDLATLDAASLRRLRRRLQWIPQDAGASLTPHRRVGRLVAEGLEAHGLAEGAEAARRARALLESLGLPARAADALPTELSSGERQRVAIARALALDPDLLICDEPVSSVDAETRAALLVLLAALRRDRGLALLVISHDLDAIRRLTDRTAVMYAGRIVEEGPTHVVTTRPAMPYTIALLAAEPTGDPNRRSARRGIVGEVDGQALTAEGCAFFPRCPHPARDWLCATSRPALEPGSDPHRVACWKR